MVSALAWQVRDPRLISEDGLIIIIQINCVQNINGLPIQASNEMSYM